MLAFKRGANEEKETLDPDLAKKYKEAEQFRRLAFVGVAFSTISIIIAVVSVPMIYNYVQAVQSVLQNEVEFCKVSCAHSYLILSLSYQRGANPYLCMSTV